MDTKLRPSGIESLGDMPWGTHFCLFYQTKDDLLEIVIPYFKAGLENHEMCVWVAATPAEVEEARQLMNSEVPGFERYLSSGQIEIISHTDWYLVDGEFTPQRIIQSWIDKHDQALATGYAGLRCMGNTFWLEKHHWESFTEYEAELDKTLGKLQILVLCTYAVERCRAEDVLNVVQQHQFTVVRRDGTWEHLEGSELKRAHAEILNLNAELEQRVAERTAQLATANEQLKLEIIERKLAEDRVRLVIDMIPAMVFTALPDGSVDFVNQRWLQYMGLSLEDVQGWSWNVTIHPEDRGRSVEHWRSAIAAGQLAENELRVRRADGVYRWILGRFVPLRDELGRIVKWYGASTDIDDRKRAEEALRKSVRLLREAESLGHTGSWEQDLVTGEIVNTEENLRLFFGDDRSKGVPFEDYSQAVHPDDRQYVMRRRAQLLEGGPPDIEYRVVWPDGSVHVLFGLATIVLGESGQPIRVYGTNLDITERKQAEEALRQSESNFRTLAEKSLEGIQLYQGGRSVYANAAMTALLGYTQEELGAMSMEEHIALVHPLDRAIAVERARRRQASQEVPASLEVRLLTKAGATRWVQGFTNEIEYNGQPAMLSTAIDITERKQAEAERGRLFDELIQSHEQLKTLSSRLAETQESERRQLALELHDEFGQSLSALKMDLAWLHDHLSPRSKSLREKVDSALDLTNDTIQMTHRLASQLRPRMLDDLGLAAALEWHVNEWSKRTRIKTKVNLPEEEWQLGTPINTALYRICQEALTNVARHATASKVEVSLAREGDEVKLIVHDNGRGMDGRKITTPESLGLLGMKERVEQIGGRFEVQSEAGNGTTVVARVPVPPSPPPQATLSSTGAYGQTRKAPKGRRSKRSKS